MVKVVSRYRYRLLLSTIGLLYLLLVMQMYPVQREVKTNLLFQVRSYLLA